MKQLFMVLLMLLLPVQAFADKDTYIKGTLGITMMGDIDTYFNGGQNNEYEGSYETDTSVSFGAAIGKSFASGFDIELEYSNRGVDTSNHIHKELDFDDIDGEPYLRPDRTFDDWEEELGIQTFMVNAIYNFKNSSMFTPYIGVGGGIAFLSFDEDLYKDSQNFAYQLMAGVDTEITKDFSILAGYRYLSAGELKRNKAMEFYGVWDDGFDKENPDFDDRDYDVGGISATIDAHIVDISLKYYF